MAIKDIILNNNEGIQTAIDLLDTLEDKGINLTGMSISKLQVFNVEFTSNATSVDHPLGEIPRICIGWMVSCTNTSAMFYDKVFSNLTVIFISLVHMVEKMLQRLLVYILIQLLIKQQLILIVKYSWVNQVELKLYIFRQDLFGIS